MRFWIPFLFAFVLYPCFSQDNGIPDRGDYRQVLEGFAMGTPVSGEWTLAGGNLTQENTLLPHAKYLLAIAQKKTNYLYSFSAIATGGGRLGYGLHFFASGHSGEDLYGFGSSFLVWVTRDVEHYRNGGTYVQLYRSFDDRRMIEAGSVLVQDSIAEVLSMEVYVNADVGIISVSINGDLKLFLPVKDFNFEGTGVALRTLGGPVVFRSLEVLEKK